MNAEVLAQGQCGIGATNLDEWERAFLFLFQNPEKGNGMGKEGRKIIENHYSTESNFTSLIKVFKDIIHP